jgi:hypothetical protein
MEKISTDKSKLQMVSYRFWENLSDIFPWILVCQGALLYVVYPQARTYLAFLFDLAIFRTSGNAVFLCTYASAIALYLFAFFRLQRATNSFIRALVLSAAFPFCATSFFEQIYQTIGYVWFHFPEFSVSFLAWSINLSSIAMIFSSVSYWRVNRLVFGSILVAVIAGFALWAVVD